MGIQIFLSSAFLFFIFYLIWRANFQPEKTTGVKRLTVDSLIEAEKRKKDIEVADIKRKLIQELEIIVESGLNLTINETIDKISTDVSAETTLKTLKKEMDKFSVSVKTNQIFTRVLSGTEINYAVNKARRKVEDKLYYSITS